MWQPPGKRVDGKSSQAGSLGRNMHSDINNITTMTFKCKNFKWLLHVTSCLLAEKTLPRRGNALFGTANHLLAVYGDVRPDNFEDNIADAHAVTRLHVFKTTGTRQWLLARCSLCVCSESYLDGIIDVTRRREVVFGWTSVYGPFPNNL